MNEIDPNHVTTAIAFDEAASLLWRQRLGLKARTGSREIRQTEERTADTKLGTALLDATREIHRQA
jgi:hypothetical protein